MKIAVEGCGHGELDKIYETIQYLEQREGIKVDLLLCCGDFQAVRNEADLECMAVPKKYREINTFYKYYSGEKTAPILTIFIGGNHEASNYLAELPYGGWVCPNIYYMGYASVLNYGGIRIGGMSGIFKGRDYKMGHHEGPPYSQDTMRSAYHIRNLEVFRLQQIKQPMDIMMSHDWPKGVYRHGNKEALIRMKPFMRDEVMTNTLGSGPTEEVLSTMKPDYWFSAHLHVKFAALVKHKAEEDGQQKQTKFLALDKCLPRRDFLQVVDIPHKSEPPFQLTYDPEWFAILKETDHLLSTENKVKHMPAQFFNDRWDFSVTLEQILAVKGAFSDDLKVPLNFVKTVPAYNPSNPNRNARQPNLLINPQTTEICTKLGITDPCALLLGSDHNTSGQSSQDGNHGDVSIGEEDDDPTYTSFMLDSSAANPDEISLDAGSSDDETAAKEQNEDRTDTGVSPNRGRLSLSLPPVKGEKSSLHKFPDSSSGETSSTVDEDSLPDPKDDLSKVTTSTPLIPRVIKRRNLQIYKSEDEANSDDRDKESQGGSSVSTESSPGLGTEASPNCGGRQIKKIKRRNQAIYTSNDDDDE